MNEKLETMSEKQQVFVNWTMDIFLYVIILNFFVEHVDKIYIESFTISFFTAVVLKILVYLLGNVEHKIKHWFDQRGQKTIGTIVVVLVLFISKFIILEIINVIFGDEVIIKGFIPLAVMIVTMMVASNLLHKLYKSLK